MYSSDQFQQTKKTGKEGSNGSPRSVPEKEYDKYAIKKTTRIKQIFIHKRERQERKKSPIWAVVVSINCLSLVTNWTKEKHSLAYFEI